MKQYLLDTNVISELRKRKPHGGVVAWLQTLRDDQICLSAVTMGEIQSGIGRTRKQGADKALEIEKWADRVEDSYQVLAMDATCFREYARLMSGRPHHLLEDMMIAATARVHDLTVATRNVRDFAGLGVDVVNPFAGTTP